MLFPNHITASMDSAQNLLIVEDDAELASMVSEFLSANGFHVAVESNGTTAQQRILAGDFDAVVLDIGLPGTDGITICKNVRERFTGPILMLTARGDEIDEVLSLEVGADDYMSKPIRPRALLARLRLHMRRAETAISDDPSQVKRLEIDNLVIDASSRNVKLEDKSIELTTAEFDLLWLLAMNAGDVVTRETLYQDLQGYPYDGLDRSIDLRVSRLRKKLGDDPNHPTRVKSVRGVGYLLASES